MKKIILQYKDYGRVSSLSSRLLVEQLEDLEVIIETDIHDIVLSYSLSDNKWYVHNKYSLDLSGGGSKMLKEEIELSDLAGFILYQYEETPLVSHNK